MFFSSFEDAKRENKGKRRVHRRPPPLQKRVALMLIPIRRHKIKTLFLIEDIKPYSVNTDGNNNTIY